MLDVAGLQDLVDQVTYKDGWIFEVWEYPDEWPHDPHMLRVCIEAPDAYNPGETVTLSIWSPIPPMAGTQAFCDWLLWRICRIEVHEAREFFRVGGKVWSDPHKDG